MSDSQEVREVHEEDHAQYEQREEQHENQQERQEESKQQQKEEQRSQEMGLMSSIQQAVANSVSTAVAGTTAANLLKTLSEDRNSRDSAILQVCKERKKESFNQLKNWDDRRTQFLTIHKNIIDSIYFKIEKRMKISQDSMSQVLKFFKERRDQEQSYSKLFSTKIPQLSSCWRDVSDQQSDWYPTLSQALKETDELNQSLGKNVLTLVMYLEKNIIKDMIFHENEEFEKKIKLLRNNISDQQARLEKASQYTTKKNNSYSQLYQQMMALDAYDNKLKLKRKDLLNVEIKFRQAAFDMIKEQKELGQQVLNYWEEARKMEGIRLEMIQKVFQLYMTKHQETYGKHPLMEQSLLNFQKFESVKESGENFSIAKIINEDDQSSIKKTLNTSSALNWQDIIKYVINFNFKDISINQHPLVQKKFKIMRDVGSVTKSFKECWMVATVDDLLLFYDEISTKDKSKQKGSALTEGGTKVNNQPKKKLLLDYLKVKPREDPSLIDIIEKTPGLLFDSTNKQLIKFTKEDDFEEFKVFLTRYQQLDLQNVPDLGISKSK
ncbi:hypothetical protein TTHERM_00137900 (macronuclear) [Tetrahymena thermophila SB210]|uniref:Uncharacterized protein n=1 Tax=Tetrahymena thermophila (strain SB210) TaxID=312017 RepID=I7MKL8_TETTS|nr:hypothetical protein TTHERM_00137900 [Tetrahymena thermophila SB210]EAR99527.2 hypothetical protein TTHERM_00137900 [Tetrahymena thermophila SB210]|eukprot:XP_001019772.2 hypothetical protein TTHERM_00137900 [Tetrahymena thermophila SB210]